MSVTHSPNLKILMRPHTFKWRVDGEGEFLNPSEIYVKVIPYTAHGRMRQREQVII